MTQRHTYELVVFDSENSNAATYNSATENTTVKAPMYRSTTLPS
jgi:hypothetical protein